MGIVATTPRDGATQRATWKHAATEGRYSAAVTRSDVYDARGRRGWSFELGFIPAEKYVGTGSIGWHRTFADPRDMIYTAAAAPDAASPHDMLRTLASLVLAWDGMIRADPAGDYEDLFPQSCRDFLGAAELFALDVELAPIGWE
jgi:hypothetical protein